MLAMSNTQFSPRVGQDLHAAVPPFPQEYRIGDKFVRVDNAVARGPAPAHFTTETGSVPGLAHPQAPGSGTIEMGIGHVVDNNVALQQAVHVAGTSTTVPIPTGPLNIRPSWEVDYFRWPRLVRRLLKLHFELFGQIGDHLLAHTAPTRRRIGICSSFPREGKTTLAICLARWAALSGYRTLLIDADVDRPQLTHCSGVDIGYGWRDAIQSDLLLSEVLIRSVESGLTLLPGTLSSRSLVHNKALDQLCTITFQMKYEFDIVVLDLGTIESICAHGSEGMDLVDTMLIARDPSRSSFGQTMDTRTVLHSLGVVNTFVAQNFARGKVA
jgi:hypothetical protein